MVGCSEIQIETICANVNIDIIHPLWWMFVIKQTYSQHNCEINILLLHAIHTYVLRSQKSVFFFCKRLDRSFGDEEIVSGKKKIFQIVEHECVARCVYAIRYDA